MITNETFEQLVFPVAKVRYAGPTNTRGGRYVASIYRDSERTYRATVGFDHADSPSTNARAAALACLTKSLADNNPDASVADYVAVPGNLSADSYTFTFVPADILNG